MDTLDTAIEREFTESEAKLPEIQYEYRDHTADIQLHSWGSTLQEAFEQSGLAMFGYMTEIDSVKIRQCFEIAAKGDDLESLLFHFLDELLYLFSTEPFLVCSKLTIVEFDLDGFALKCRCYGEPFEIGVHPQGTEVKAITYSAMKIVQNPEQQRFETFVIVDI